MNESIKKNEFFNDRNLNLFKKDTEKIYIEKNLYRKEKNEKISNDELKNEDDPKKKIYTSSTDRHHLFFGKYIKAELKEFKQKTQISIDNDKKKIIDKNKFKKNRDISSRRKVRVKKNTRASQNINIKTQP